MAAKLAPDQAELAWPRLIEGVLIRRYKRFLADVRLRNGRTVTAHCPNTGSMMACSEPGRRVFLSRHDDPKRRLKYTWEIIEMPDSLVGVNTTVPNRLVMAALAAGKIPELAGYDRVKAEVRIDRQTRLDLMLESAGRGPCYVEIKNCSLVEDGKACFPDAVTERGRKHLFELEKLVEAGRRGVIFFLVQRMDARFFEPADHIDPEYGRVLRRVKAAGVEILAYDVNLTLKSIALQKRIPVMLR